MSDACVCGYYAMHTFGFSKGNVNLRVPHNPSIFFSIDRFSSTEIVTKSCCHYRKSTKVLSFTSVS